MISHFELSIITGTRAISGSAAIKFRNFVIAYTPSNIPSSMLMSIICAPPSTCSRATESASSYFSSLINRRNLREPVTFVLSPTLTKIDSSVTKSGSKPESCKFILLFLDILFLSSCDFNFKAHYLFFYNFSQPLSKRFCFDCSAFLF